MFNIATVQKPAAQALSQDGLSLLLPADLRTTLHLTTPAWLEGWQALTASWMRLPPDAHLKDGGHYRKRRHACFIHAFFVIGRMSIPAGNRARSDSVPLCHS